MFKIKLSERPTGRMSGVFSVTDDEGIVRGTLSIGMDGFFLSLRGENPWDSDTTVAYGDTADMSEIKEATAQWIDWTSALMWECVVPGGGTSRQRW